LLLRSKLGKGAVWSTLPEETRVLLRQGCLQALMVEPDKTVGNAIARLVATLARNTVCFSILQDYVDHIHD